MLINSLRIRLSLLFLTVVLVAVGTVAVFAGRGTTRSFNHYVAGNLARDEEVVAKLLSQVSDGEDQLQVQAFTQRAGEAFGRTIVVVSEEGRIVYASEPDWVGRPVPSVGVVPAVWEPIVIIQAPVEGVMQLGPPPDGPVAFSGGFSPADDQVINEVAGAAVPLATREVTFLGSVSQALWLGGVVAIGVAVILGLGLSHRLLQPIERLTAAARQLEQGDLSQRADVRRKDEIGQLAHAFNAMADGLERQEKLRQRMISDVAHELRTPLANIRGYLEACQDGVIRPEPEVLDSLYEETLLLGRLVEDLQELSLAEARQLSLNRQEVSLQSVVETAAAASLPQAQEKGITMIVEGADDLPPVYADPERVGQVLRILVHNALTYTPTGGGLTVSLTAGDSHVVVCVQDSGPGVPPADLPYIFERFYRADSSRSRATGGSGLGLAIARELVEMHNGQMEAANRPEGGAVFCFTLPVDAGHFFHPSQEQIGAPPVTFADYEDQN